MDEALALAGRIAANPGAGLRLTKRLLREGQHTRLESLLEMSAGFQAVAHKTAHHVEAINAFVEKRKPDFSAARAGRRQPPSRNGGGCLAVLGDELLVRRHDSRCNA